MLRRACVFATLALLAGCAHAAPRERLGAQAPAGIIFPRGVKPGDEVDGVFVGASRSGVWLAPHATLLLRKDRPASHLALVVYVPDTNEHQRAWYRDHPLTVDGRFDEEPRPQHRCCFSGGIASVDFTVPSALRRGREVLRLHLDVSGGVAEPGINTPLVDKRRLALVLVRLFFY